ncbi:PLP-dependent aminotransferase family protein [Shewanella algae]|uniref:MocR-like pyridoxine biosynthesis transcription factor PdxR n=1 Tax=Shewanella algae TaxID=38313 RepID=UPI0031F589F1
MKSGTKQFAYEQVYQRIKEAILTGTLSSGDRIPSSRALAVDMGVSRGTVEEGYSRLKSEGYIESNGKSGTKVSANLHTIDVEVHQYSPLQSLSQSKFDCEIPFKLGIPAMDCFPRKVWSKTIAKCARETKVIDLYQKNPQGILDLRIAIARYLQMSKGIQCKPHQIFITTGYINSINWIVQALLRNNSKVVIEDPGYPLTRKLLRSNGLVPEPTELDMEGLIIPPDGSFSAVIVTPAHQSPTCIALSLRRRKDLLKWATRNEAWIIEDDYDGDFCNGQHNNPALKSLDVNNRVIYMGTFSKVLCPSLRLAYFVVPEYKVETFLNIADLHSNNVSEFTQRAVTLFMSEGHFYRHIQRMKEVYRVRRMFTLKVLKSILNEVSVIHPDGGMNITLLLSLNKCTDVELSKYLLKKGLHVEPLSSWSTSEKKQGIIISYANIENEDECNKLVVKIKDVLQAL